MNTIDVEIIKLKLDKIFTNRYFNICDVRDILEAYEISRSKDYDKMSALHCVDYSKMSNDMKKWLRESIYNMVLNWYSMSKWTTISEIAQNGLIEQYVSLSDTSELAKQKKVLSLLNRW